MYLQPPAAAIEVPQADFPVKPAGGHPVLGLARRRNALHVVGVQANGRWGRRFVGGRAPDLHRDIGRGGDEGSAVVGEDEVVDPVRVRLHLRAELRRRRLVVGYMVVGKGVSLLFVGAGQVEAQVPGAYDAVSTA